MYIYIYVSQLFISRMPKMRAIPQLVSAPLNSRYLNSTLNSGTFEAQFNDQVRGFK